MGLRGQADEESHEYRQRWIDRFIDEVVEATFFLDFVLYRIVGIYFSFKLVDSKNTCFIGIDNDRQKFWLHL